jgi:hypothetical protein
MSNQQRFQVGDLCVIVSCDHDPSYVGNECEIVSIGGGILDCTVKIPGRPSPHRNGNWSATFSQLRKKAPPADYDGNQAGSWDLIPWQPSKVREREHG